MPQENTNKDVVRRSGEEDTYKKPPTSKGNSYLLTIAIDNYQHCPKLFNCVRDATGLIEVLNRNYGFQPAHIKTLFNEEATERNIFRAFRELAQTLTNLDNLIIFFSGHGEYDKVFGEGYWVPIDAKEGAQEDYIANGKIKTFLDAIQSKHTFLIVDSCFSGSLFTQFKNVALADRLSSTPSRWGLTAGRNEIVADGTAGTNSPFARELLYQLQHATKPIGVANLCNKVVETVIANANQTPRGEPLKIRGHKGGQYFFWPKDYPVQESQESISPIPISSSKETKDTPVSVVTKEKKGLPKCSIYVSVTLMALLAIGFFSWFMLSTDQSPNNAGSKEILVEDKKSTPPENTDSREILVEEKQSTPPPKEQNNPPVMTKPEREIIEVLEVEPTEEVLQNPGVDWESEELEEIEEPFIPVQEEILDPLPIVLQKASKGGKYGFKDANSGVWIVPPQYKLITAFSGGLAAVQDFNYKWGYIDEIGELVIPLVIDQPTKFGNKKRVRVMINAEWVTINKMGKVQVGNQVMDLTEYVESY